MSSANHGRELGELYTQKSVREYKANHNPFKEKKKDYIYVLYMCVYTWLYIHGWVVGCCLYAKRTVLENHVQLLKS